MLSKALRNTARVKNRTVVQGSAMNPGNLGENGMHGIVESVTYGTHSRGQGTTLSSSTTETTVLISIALETADEIWQVGRRGGRYS